MPSHKQKRDRKKSHKHRHRNRSRSPLRRRNIQRKNEGKKENIPHNSGNMDAEKLKDLSSYMENRKEMIRQMFAAVGEDFLVKHIPTILERVSREELKRVCYEELSKLSDDIVFKILEGIPCDTEEVSSPAERTSSQSCSGHTPVASPEKESSKGNEGCEESKPASSKGDDNSSSEELSSDDRRSESLASCSSEESLKSCEKGDSKASEDDTSDVKCEVATSSCHPSLTKKLAKVAPFHISIPKPEPQKPSGNVNEEEGCENSDIDNETSSEIVDLGLEEDIEDVESESDSLEDELMSEAPPHVSAVVENSDSDEVTEEEMQQNLSEVLELEHRARAIRSMLANIDRFQA